MKMKKKKIIPYEHSDAKFIKTKSYTLSPRARYSSSGSDSDEEIYLYK
jgi:hypothetical protein